MSACVALPIGLTGSGSGQGPLSSSIAAPVYFQVAVKQAAQGSWRLSGSSAATAIGRTLERSRHFSDAREGPSGGGLQLSITITMNHDVNDTLKSYVTLLTAGLFPVLYTHDLILDANVDSPEEETASYRLRRECKSLAWLPFAPAAIFLTEQAAARKMVQDATDELLQSLVQDGHVPASP